MSDVINRLMDKYLERGKRIAELDTENKRLKNRGTITSPMDGLFEENERLKAKLDAVQPLPDKWRKYTFDNPEATSYIDSADCADELEEALGEAK